MIWGCFCTVKRTVEDCYLTHLIMDCIIFSCVLLEILEAKIVVVDYVKFGIELSVLLYFRVFFV